MVSDLVKGETLLAEGKVSSINWGKDGIARSVNDENGNSYNLDTPISRGNYEYQHGAEAIPDANTNTWYVEKNGLDYPVDALGTVGDYYAGKGYKVIQGVGGRHFSISPDGREWYTTAPLTQAQEENYKNSAALNTASQTATMPTDIAEYVAKKRGTELPKEFNIVKYIGNGPTYMIQGINYYEDFKNYSGKDLVFAIGADTVGNTTGRIIGAIGGYAKIRNPIGVFVGGIGAGVVGDHISFIIKEELSKTDKIKMKEGKK